MTFDQRWSLMLYDIDGRTPLMEDEGDFETLTLRDIETQKKCLDPAFFFKLKFYFQTFNFSWTTILFWNKYFFAPKFFPFKKFFRQNSFLKLRDLLKKPRKDQTKPNPQKQTNQIKSNKLSLLNQAYKTIPTKPIPRNQTYQTKHS